MIKIDPCLVRESLDYNPDTGILVWKHRVLRAGFERVDKAWNTAHAGKIAKGQAHRHGHFQLMLFCRNYMMHRIVWAHYYGETTQGGIDHINGDPTDNRIKNLRLANQSQNLMNSKVHFDSTSGVKGVSWDKRAGKWYVYINTQYKRKFLGTFDDLSVAAKIRKEAEQKYHGEFARNT